MSGLEEILIQYNNSLFEIDKRIEMYSIEFYSTENLYDIEKSSEIFQKLVKIVSDAEIEIPSYIAEEYKKILECSKAALKKKGIFERKSKYKERVEKSVINYLKASKNFVSFLASELGIELPGLEIKEKNEIKPVEEDSKFFRLIDAYSLVLQHQDEDWKVLKPFVSNMENVFKESKLVKETIYSNIRDFILVADTIFKDGKGRIMDDDVLKKEFRRLMKDVDTYLKTEKLKRERVEEDIERLKKDSEEGT